MGLFLAVRWVNAFVITLLGMGALELFSGSPVLVLAGLTIATLLFNFAFFVTVERALLRFGRCGRGTARSTTRTSGGTSATGS